MTTTELGGIRINNDTFTVTCSGTQLLTREDGKPFIGNRLTLVCNGDPIEHIDLDQSYDLAREASAMLTDLIAF